MKYCIVTVRVAKNISLCGNLDSLADILPEIAWFMGQLGLTKNWFLWQDIHSCRKKSILVARNQFLSQEINSCHKKSILITRNQFVSLEINSGHKKSFLVSSRPLVKLINLWQCVNPSKKFAWAYTFRGNPVPRFLVNLLPWLLHSLPHSTVLNC